MPHDPTDLKNRTKAYALRIIKLYQTLPNSVKLKCLEDKSCVVELQWEHNTEKHVVQNLRLTL